MSRLVLLTAINYVVARFGSLIVRDVDILPLQNKQWVTDTLLEAYTIVLSKKFSDPELNVKVGIFPQREMGSILQQDGCTILANSRTNVCIEEKLFYCHLRHSQLVILK